eukprot:m.22840 g.22840  ORF g.22840 m.22840 type:complete len:111 (+) comp5485_c0_seq1:595-927(+)
MTAPVTTSVDVAFHALFLEVKWSISVFALLTRLDQLPSPCLLECLPSLSAHSAPDVFKDSKNKWFVCFMLGILILNIRYIYWCFFSLPPPPPQFFFPLCFTSLVPLCCTT